jgi:penicillin-binding protein 1B
LGLLITGIVAGLLLPWVIYLNHIVTHEFEGRKWDLPSRVFARSLDLYPGLPLSIDNFQLELETAGYTKTRSADTPGTFATNGSQVKLFRRAFGFLEGEEGPRRVLVTFDGLAVSSIRDADSAMNLDLFRVDPAEIASIYPLHKEDRVLVSLEQAPPMLVTGLQAVEDRNFKHHPGVDLKGVLRAVVANIKAGKTVQGGSTLTQQLVKNYFLDGERTMTRKLNEAIMAVLLEWHYDKGEILEAYLNEVYLGQQGALAIHGFGRAATFYFDTPLNRLETHQLALLVGMVKGASLYNPRRHPERALNRRNSVLGVFWDTGLISGSQARQQQSKPLGVSARPSSRANRYHAFIDLVRAHLAADYKEEDLKTEGLRVFTTLSPWEQEQAQNAVSGGLDRLVARDLPAGLQGAMVVADVTSGEIKAVVGDRHANRAGFNRALDARRQVGSVIKPLVYLLALEHDSDYNLLSFIEDAPLSLRQSDGSQWSPENYDKTSHGRVTLLKALTRSYNQATVRLGLNIGASNLVQKLVQLGVDTDIAAVPSIFLGAVELTPLEVTQIYQSLAAGGFSVPLRSVTAVQTAEGESLNRYPLRLMPQPRREAIAVLNYALTQVVAGPGFQARPAVIAGKTGTSNDRRDSWFVGYTADRIGVVWVGQDDNSPAGVTGSNAAMRVWANLFRQLPLQSVDLRMPDKAHWLWADREQGLLTGEHCESAAQVPFIIGSEPTGVTACYEAMGHRDEESFWNRLFRKDG